VAISVCAPVYMPAFECIGTYYWCFSIMQLPSRHTRDSYLLFCHTWIEKHAAFPLQSASRTVVNFASSRSNCPMCLTDQITQLVEPAKDGSRAIS
jgi:hypothetical protein